MKFYNKSYTTKYGKINVPIYGLNDLIVDQRKAAAYNGTLLTGFINLFKRALKNKKCKEGYYLYHIPYWWKVKIINAKICSVFFDKMIRDMIYNDTEFIFPDDTCRLSAGIKVFTDPERVNEFKYNKYTNGFTPTLRIVFENNIFVNKLKRLRYYFRISPKYYKMMMKEVIENNHEYINTGRYDNSK